MKSLFISNISSLLITILKNKINKQWNWYMSRNITDVQKMSNNHLIALCVHKYYKLVEQILQIFIYRQASKLALACCNLYICLLYIHTYVVCEKKENRNTISIQISTWINEFRKVIFKMYFFYKPNTFLYAPKQ